MPGHRGIPAPARRYLPVRTGTTGNIRRDIQGADDADDTNDSFTAKIRKIRVIRVIRA